MQRAVGRPRGSLAREDESESEDERLLDALAAVAASATAGDAAWDAEPEGKADAAHEPNEPKKETKEEKTKTEKGTARFASSGAQVRLHTYEAAAARPTRGFVETKIGGHALDHRRPFRDDAWARRLGGPVKTAVVGAVRALGSALAAVGASSSPPSPSSSSSRSSPAFDARKRDVLVYSSVKIAGHAMDHVPFLSRGQPSRPLWGYVPNLGWPSAESPSVRSVQGGHIAPPAAAAAARVFQIEPSALATLYDCSRCLRLRRTPRVQLCCGHALCAACVSSDALRHAEMELETDRQQRACFLDCARCGDLVAVEAVVFTNHVVRLPAPPARSLSALGSASDSTPGSSSSSLARLGLAWRHGGVIAVLSFVAGRLYPGGKTRRSALGSWHGVRSSHGSLLDDVQEMVAPPPPPPPSPPTTTETQTRRLLDDVADIAKRLAPSADEVVAGGAARWAKRVQGLQPPSKLLKFAFVRTLGVGNFAEVMLVRDRRGELSVLKESDKLPEAVNEISLLSRVSSPHVVRIRQFFVEEVGHRHFAYIEMEFCDGGDLLQLLRDKGPMAEHEFAAIFRQLCAGLKEIHDRGIVHRDLKPGNVLMTTDGVAKIADFGVSTRLESDLLTHHAAGTLAFMAPEVRRYFLGEDVSYDAKADVWSLGALAVAMLTGNPEPRVATRPLEDVVDHLRELGMSDNSIELVERTLQPLPEERPTLADLLADARAAKARL